MSHQDSLKQLMADLQARNLDRRSFVTRASALGLSARAMTMLLGAVGVAAPAGVAAAAAQEASGTLRFAVTTDPETLDPQMTSNGSAWEVFNRIYSSLVYQDIDLTYKGLLAESWETSADNLEITFKLKEGITFHDGSAVDAEAVKFTYERLATEGAKNPNHEMAKTITVTAVDPLTVTFTFETPSAIFFHAISDGYGGILSPAAVEAGGEDYGRAPVGTNSYKLSDWQTGTTVTLAAFEEFKAVEGYFTNTGPAKIAEIQYKVIPEEFAQTASLETGEVDAVQLSATDLPRFENDDRFEIFPSSGTGVMYLGMVRVRPLMEDPLVRKAVAHAINRQEIVDTLFSGGLAQATATPLPPSVPGYNEELEALAPAFDIEAGKALLEEAGWIEGEDGIREKDGEKLAPLLYTTTATDMGQLATLIQAQLRLIGVDAKINQLEVAALLDFTPKGEHDMLLLSYGWGDPNALYLFLSTDRLPTSNRTHYSNPALDELLVKGQQELDWDARMQVYYDAQTILLEDLPWVPLFMPISKTAIAKNVKDVGMFPHSGWVLIHDATVEN